ncbi:hypothetical protein [Novosphingobium humi]|uniref:hypothetical protein n=1 Tax=Novosphingobium humi TaxID=2282397 RepID=UPI0025B1B0F4|nr:hypothetical protein [Novosphingobium humi]WJT00454.1 hypothetical protein NYQ05_19425 [Novosphingobium humi]
MTKSRPWEIVNAPDGRLQMGGQAQFLADSHNVEGKSGKIPSRIGFGPAADRRLVRAGSARHLINPPIYQS